jgi:hypothetical protein
VNKKVLNGLFLVLSISATEAQNLQISPMSADAAWYDQLLYSGVEWQPAMRMAAGHEFFLTSESLSGTVSIDGTIFRDIRMKYDIFNDGLIVLWKNGSPIVVDNKKVDEFTIIYNGIPRRFVNLRETYPGIRGFAEIMYQGTSSVIAKHIKVVSKNPAGANYAEFREETRYYLMLNGNCSQVKNRTSFLDLMGEYEMPVRKYIRQKNLYLSQSSPEGFIIAAAYYDSLTVNAKPE